MSTQRMLQKAEWKTFFTQVTHALQGKQAEIEVASLDLGDQVMVEWIPVIGVTYDHHDDLLDVALNGLTHLIRHPREILIHEEPAGIGAIAVVAGDGTKQTIRLKAPLALPPAAV